MPVQNIRFMMPASDGAPIAGNVRTTGDSFSRPIVLILHGFKGFKDWGFFPYTAEYFARHGAIAIQFNFSLNGVREGSDVFDDLDNFARNTISREREEAGMLVQAIHDGSFAAQTGALDHWNGELFLLGHSRGGGVALLVARDHADKVSRTAVWNAVSTFDRFTPRQKKEWRERGVLESINTRTKQKMAMNVLYLDDVELHAEALTPATAIADCPNPVLIVHAEQDMTVPVREARVLAEAQPRARLELVPQAGHTFNAVHPFTGSTPQLEYALRITREFFGLPDYL